MASRSAPRYFKHLIIMLAFAMPAATAPLASGEGRAGGDTLPISRAASTLSAPVESPAPITITSLSSAVNMAFRNNLDLANGRLEIESRRQKRNEIRADLRNRETLLGRQIEKEIRDANNSLLYASVRLKNQDANRELAQEVYGETEIEYQDGTASISDLLTAENSLLESQRQYMSALADRITAQVLLCKAQGTLLNAFDTSKGEPDDKR